MENHLSKYVVFSLNVFLLALGPGSALGKVFVFPSENSVSPCIFIDANFTLEFTALNNITNVASRILTQDDIASVTGSCVPAVISLSFTNNSNWFFQFNQDPNGEVHLQRSIQYIPSDVFGSRVKDTGVVSVKEERPINLSKPPFSYQCDTPEVLQYTSKSISHKSVRYNIQANVLKIHIHGFDANRENINTPIKCALDNSRNVPQSFKMAADTSNIQAQILRADNNTSSSGETTSTPQSLNTTSAASSTSTSVQTTINTTPQPQIHVNTYIVSDGNVNCILLQGAIAVSIEYLYNLSTSEKPTTKTVNLNIPANATGTGNCNHTDNSQSLVISFFDDWSLEIIFTLDDGKISTTQVSTDRTYKITNLTLTYVTNSTLFPGSDIPPETTITDYPKSSKDTDYPKKSSGDNYYKCNKNIDMKIVNGITVKTTGLLFIAFNTNNDTTFSGTPDECAGDEETDQTVPIAVASTLGGLTAVVIIFYAISKIRNKE